jgi:large subunit ribosomal protein L18
MDRINGSHISKYAKSLASEQEVYKKRFSKYLGRGLKPEDLSNHFEQVRKTVLEGPLEAKR